MLCEGKVSPPAHLCGSLLMASAELNHAWTDRGAILLHRMAQRQEPKLCPTGQNMPESVASDSYLHEVTKCFPISAFLGAGMDGEERGSGDLYLCVHWLNDYSFQILRS